MRVIFERIDGRSYRIGVRRDGRHDVGPDVPVRLAPGWATVPHDLVHFAVEEQARLSLGVFGQVAAGGDCGGFFRPAPDDRHPAGDARRSARLGRAGRADAALSEHLAALAVTGRIADDAPVDPRVRDAINTRLQQLLSQWRTVPAGGRLELVWPDDLTIRHGRAPLASAR